MEDAAGRRWVRNTSLALGRLIRLKLPAFLALGTRRFRYLARGVSAVAAQRAALNSLNEATAKAAELLKADCPKDDSLTPPVRVTLMEKRLAVMLNAIKIVQPELETFYGLLTDEQKARFNQLSHAEG